MFGSVSVGFLATEVEDSDGLSPPVSEKKREAGYAGWLLGRFLAHARQKAGIRPVYFSISFTRI